jgi:nucleotide-binding universal stress UspA family protein
MYRNILVPIDGSPTATLGLREAIGLARRLGSRLRMFHVVNGALWLGPESASAQIAEILAQMRSTGESIVHEAKVTARAAGIAEVDGTLIESASQHPGDLILAEARDWPADLIVCGTHGRRGLRRILMGSDAEYIVRSSPVPVLLVRGG